MGLGILVDPHLGDNVPGTSLLDDLHSLNRTAVVSPGNSNLKRNKNGIVLVPQPSSSPDDPLNWPYWRKVMLMGTITYGAGVVGAFGPIIAAGLTQVASDLNTTVDSLSMMTGDLCLALGLVLIVIVPVSVILGRRPVFLLGSVLLLVSSIWSATSKDISSLVASRVIGGMGMAPMNGLAEAIIADVFFVHERGTWISVWSFAYLGGICGVSIVNGYLIQYISWRVCFVIEAVLCAVFFALVTFFVPETAYVRDKLTEGGSVTSVEPNKAPSSDVEVEAFEADGTHKFSYWRSLSPWAGRRFTDQSFWKIALRPFTLLCSPVVAWGTLVNGTTDAWIVALSISVSLLFSSPAYGYNFSAGVVGLISGIGPLIASMLGNALAGPLSDWSVTWLSRRNGGIYEPEFRLFMVIPMLITTTIGWFGWAISAHLLELWIAPTIFYSLINFGLAVGTIGVFAYVMDAHGRYSAETFGAITLVKNVFIFALTYFYIPWLNSQGVLRTFCTIGGVNIVVCLMTIPMYIYGKRARSWVHRTPWMLT